MTRLRPVASHRRRRRNRDPCARQFEPDLTGDLRLRLAQARDLDFGGSSQLFGFFRSRRAATEQLRALAWLLFLLPTLFAIPLVWRVGMARSRANSHPG